MILVQNTPKKSEDGQLECLQNNIISLVHQTGADGHHRFFFYCKNENITIWDSWLMEKHSCAHIYKTGFLSHNSLKIKIK